MSTLEYLDKEINDFTHDDWIQFTELIEQLGGSKALREPTELSEELDFAEELDLTKTGSDTWISAAVTVKIRKRGPLYTIHTGAPYRGRGAITGTGLAQLDNAGTLISPSSNILKTTNRVIVKKQDGKLKCTFGQNTRPTGKVDGSVVTGNPAATGPFSFS